jgi:hypothetical protein
VPAWIIDILLFPRAMSFLASSAMAQAFSNAPITTFFPEGSRLHFSRILVQFVVVSIMFFPRTVWGVHSTGEFPSLNPGIRYPFLSPANIESGVLFASSLASLMVNTGKILDAPFSIAVIIVLLALSTSITIIMSLSLDAFATPCTPVLIATFCPFVLKIVSRFILSWC